MADKETKDDKPAGQADPSSVVSSNNGLDGKEEQSSAETKNTENKLPYHQDPELQDYINRQVEKRVFGILQENNNNGNREKDELSDIAKELTDEFGIDSSIAIKYAKVIEKIADRVSDKKLVNVQVSLKNATLQNKINNFAMGHPDLFQLKDEMLRTLQRLPQDEQDFIRNSENGIEYLYDKVKVQVLSNHQQNKYLGGSGGGGTGGNSKLNQGGSILDKANQAFQRGNVKEYNALMAEYNASKK